MSNIINLPGEILEEGGTIIKRQQTLGAEEIELAQQTVSQGLDGAQRIMMDTERNIGKIANNFQDNAFYSGRYVAKNVVSLIDNQLDNVFNLIQDVRVDIANGMQLFAIITATGLVVIAILYGDQLVKRGITLGEISLF